MSLDAPTFIRRFLLHSLSDGFRQIGQFGVIANGHRAEKLALCRRLLDAPPPEPTTEPAEDAPPAHRQDRRPGCGSAMITPADLGLPE